MNIANLQLEGLYIAIVELQRLLVSKGLIEKKELDESLRRAEIIVTSDNRGGTLSPAEQDAMAFSIRVLRAANRYDRGQQQNLPSSFSRLARIVGETKARDEQTYS